MTSYTHTLQDYDSDSRDTLPVTITLDDVSIRVDECGGDLRGVTVEMTNGTMKVRVYASDSEVPVTIVLPETGGLEVDRHDYDMQSPPAENDIDPGAVYVIINTDEPDDRQFWSNDQGWVGDLESATIWMGHEVHKVCPPMSGGWIKKEVFQ
ncbi:hypothetical protein RCZAHN_100 [Rhodobacter phage RcZahn]|nr:hypothetical protein RCZAHN_100 [Rhodobacter phage RcZahn]